MTPQSAPLLPARLLAAPLLAAALLLGACGSPAPTPDPSGFVTPAATTTPPTIRLLPQLDTVSPPRGPVTGQGTVLQTPQGPPQLCLGAVAESWPPQCSGIPLRGWDWSEVRPFEQADLGGQVTRWSTYAVTGRFDGSTMTVTDVVPLPLYDPAAEPSPPTPTPPAFDEGQWDAVRQRLMGVPGLLTVDRPDDAGPLQLFVVHDDGSIQAWADASFGAGAVLVTSALR